MIKKFFKVFLAMVMVISVSACGTNKNLTEVSENEKASSDENYMPMYYYSDDLGYLCAEFNYNDVKTFILNGPEDFFVNTRKYVNNEFVNADGFYDRNPEKKEQIKRLFADATYVPISRGYNGALEPVDICEFTNRLYMEGETPEGCVKQQYFINYYNIKTKGTYASPYEMYFITYYTDEAWQWIESLKDGREYYELPDYYNGEKCIIVCGNENDPVLHNVAYLCFRYEDALIVMRSFFGYEVTSQHMEGNFLSGIGFRDFIKE